MQIPHDSQELKAVRLDTQQEAHEWPRAIISLRHRNFRLFWCTQLISLMGTWMQSIGQSWLVLELTHSAWLLGVVGALQFLPILIFGLFGGLLADKLPKRKVLVWTQAASAVQAVIIWLLVMSGQVQLWHVLVLALILGITNAIDMPTRQSFVVEMVGREDLANAIALNSSSFNMARIVGPSIGGIMIARLGEAPLFLINALSFIPVITGLLLINSQQLHAQVQKQLDGTKQGTLQGLREGLGYVRYMPAVFLIIVTVGVISLFGINFNVVLPLFASDVLQAGPNGYGFISAAFGMGALLAAIWLAWRNASPSIQHIVVFGLLFAIFEALFALSHWYALSLLLIACVGFTMISFAAMANTTLQTVTPNKLRGRIMSVYLLVFNGSTPIGNLFTGAMANWVGTSLSLFVGALISLIAAIGGWIYRKPAEQSIKEFNNLDN